MLDESITDFRNVIEEKLRFKKSALDQTEQHLRKFSVLRDANRTSSGREHVQSSKPSIRGRLGPKASLESRLGPKVTDEHEDDDMKPTIMSRVVVESQKSRDEALAEENEKMGKREKQRNRRMFGNLLGTLQKFKQDENRVKVREQKKRDVEKKIEEKTEKEKEEAKRTKNELFSEKKKQQQEIRMLQIQMTRVQEYELWEKNKRREMQHIRTNVPDQPQIFYMPREHNDKTMAKYEATVQSIEEEIKAAKITFEEELLKIETKINQNSYEDDGEEEDEEDDDEEISKRTRSVIVKQPHKRVRNESENGLSHHDKDAQHQPEPKKVKEEKVERERRNSGSSNSPTSDEK